MTSPISRVTVRLALAFLAAAMLLVASFGERAVASDRYTPVIQSVMSKPSWFRDATGQIRLVYELHLTNAFPVPVTIDRVTVKHPKAKRTLQDLTGAELLAAMTPAASPGEASVEIPPSSNSVVWMDVPFDSRAAIPRGVRHTVVTHVPPGLPVPSEISSTGGYSRIDRRAPITLEPPLSGKGWIAVGSCCDGPHRRSIQPVNGKLRAGQRFAIDWNGFDAQQRFVDGDPSLNESWTFYGKPVLAVAGAKVVRAVDRFPDQIPNDPAPVTIEEADGNYVILRLGDGRFAFYAHLAPGSVAVERGERVQAGDVIGELGNSGSSTGPHLHFQVMDAPSALDSNGLPYVFDRFRRVGQIPPLTQALMDLVNAGGSVPVEPVPSGRHRAELPLGRDVIDFRGVEGPAN